MYISGDIKMNIVRRSPLHKDTHPSFSIGASPSGKLIWKDWAADKSGGPIDLVQEIYGLTYPQALEKVCKDFDLLQQDSMQYKKIVGSYIQPVIEKIETVIHVKAGKWSKTALKYWEGYGISLEQLKTEEVYPVDEWYLHRKKQMQGKDELVFAYRYPGNRFKIYMPQREKSDKWKNNITCDLVENLENLNSDKRVLIAKSKKDRICLQQVVPYTVLSVQNEGMSAYTEEFRKQLEGRDVVICYDADEPGVRNCKKICDMYKYQYVNTPRYLLSDGIKDPSDWIKGVGSSEPLRAFLRKKQVI